MIPHSMGYTLKKIKYKKGEVPKKNPNFIVALHINMRSLIFLPHTVWKVSRGWTYGWAD